MAKEFKSHFLNARITHQECQASLLGNDTDPLLKKAKKHCKRSSERFSSELKERTSSDIFSDLHTGFKNDSGYTKENDDTFQDYQKSFSTSFLTKNEEIKKKKKENKKAKKRKKKSKKMLLTLDENVFEKAPRNANILSEVYKNTESVLTQNGFLYVYDEEDGCYHQKSANEIAADIKEQLPEDMQMKIGTRDYKEAFDLIKISNELSSDEGFLENKPYVNCLNGIVDVKTGELLEHSPDFRFKHCIHAKYIPGSQCPKFMEYVDCITGGDKELKKLLQVIIAYFSSHYNNAKLAVLIYGIPHTGKSVLCNVLSRIIGEEHTANIDLNMLSRPEYAASLSSKILNVAPDLRNEPMQEVGFFKSLISHDDTIMARTLYDNPKKIKCETKMLFSTNHLISFVPDIGPYDIEAVFNRLLYFPFQNKPICKNLENKHLSDEIYAERDAIFTWAMKGLKFYVEQNETFPECKLSEEIKARNMAQFCPEKIFFSEAIKSAEGRYESSFAIKTAFEAFCAENSAKVKGDIYAYLEEHEGIPKLKTKKRIDADGYPCSEGNPIAVFEGIRLKNKYRPAE